MGGCTPQYVFICFFSWRVLVFPMGHRAMALSWRTVGIAMAVRGMPWQCVALALPCRGTPRHAMALDGNSSAPTNCHGVSWQCHGGAMDIHGSAIGFSRHVLSWHAMKTTMVLTPCIATKRPHGNSNARQNDPLEFHGNTMAMLWHCQNSAMTIPRRMHGVAKGAHGIAVSAHGNAMAGLTIVMAMP